jgi:hypothetical protein
MSSEERLRKCFDLSQFSKELFLQGLRRRFGDLPEEKVREIYLMRLDKCHNRNY